MTNVVVCLGIHPGHQLPGLQPGQLQQLQAAGLQPAQLQQLQGVPGEMH